jgi:regulator of replication initiation timing
MAKAAVAPRGVELDAIDRLEEKIRLLIDVVERMKAEQARAADENIRLMREVETLRGRLSDAENTGAELTMLREERDVIRTRVSEMLQQIDALNL